MTPAEPRARLLVVFEAALAAVRGRERVAEHLRAHRPAGSVELLAIGKAAASMAAGAFDALGSSIRRALVITKIGHCQPPLPAGVDARCLESAHPVPDGRSLVAGEALLGRIASTPETARLLVLISGGASSLVEVPVEGLDERELARVNRWLLGSGLDIDAMNRVRKALSRIKGGRLAAWLGGRETHCLLISDVPGDDPRAIGSGLLVAHREEDLGLAGLEVPSWLRRLAERAPPPAPPEAFRNVRCEVIASPARAREAAASRGRALGHAVHSHAMLITGEAVGAGRRLAREVLDGPPGLYIWGGETTVVLPPDPGRGGRCQSLALAAAIALQGREDIFFLAAGSDGTDGPGSDAGALVDGGTVARGRAAGLEPETALERADAGRFLEASGDLVRTGPTGTNVMDLILALKRDGTADPPPLSKG